MNTGFFSKTTKLLSGAFQFVCYHLSCSTEITRATARDCGMPPQAANTESTDYGTTYRAGDTIQLKCKSGYASVTREDNCTCQSSGLWDEQCANSVRCSGRSFVLFFVTTLLSQINY